MFAVSENICIFVMPRNVRITESKRYIQNRNNKAGFLRQFYFGSLAFLGGNKGASPVLFCTYCKNFFLKMPRNEKVSSTKVNNSNLSAQPTHKFRIRITSHLTKNPKLCANIFGWTNILSIFVVPNKLIHSINPIDSLYFRYKAGFSGLSYFRVDSLFGDIKEGLAHSLLLSTVKY